jgi:hypothetical protein
LETVRLAIESFLRLAKSEIHGGTVLVAADDAFEVKDVPSVILQGPSLTENRDRRTMVRIFEKQVADLTYTETRSPRLYHLDFDVIVTTGKEAELLDLTEKVARFYQLFPDLTIPDRGALNVTELVPLGGLGRVNLSNLRQSSGRLRIEDCPVWDGRIEVGKLIRDRIFEMRGTLNEDRHLPPVVL